MTDEAPADEAPADAIARRRLGAALRSLGHRVVGTAASVDILEATAETLSALIKRLEGPPRSRRSDDHDRHFEAPADGGTFREQPDRPFAGSASPWGCDMDVRRVGQEVVATMTLGSAHEGAPGRAHGGIVSGILDDVLGFVLQLEETAAYTGELAVRYEVGVPLHREIIVRARLVERVGRKLFMSADAWDGDQRLATATATFVAPAAPPGPATTAGS